VRAPWQGWNRVILPFAARQNSGEVSMKLRRLRLGAQPPNGSQKYEFRKQRWFAEDCKS
jgi:hypothetical protein